jgi:hypothetical protein
MGQIEILFYQGLDIGAEPSAPERTGGKFLLGCGPYQGVKGDVHPRSLSLFVLCVFTHGKNNRALIP